MNKQDDIALTVKNVSKSFHLPKEQASGIKQAFINWTRGVKGYDEQRVLRDISFEIKKGDFFGIVGRNGSGKSTLLKIISEIYTYDKGSIEIHGKLVPLIELGVGFNPELTGRENIYMNGAMLGFSNAEVDTMYNEIVDFAELHEFMDQKLKNYSSGMQVRLAFSIAIRAKSDILLIDEVLAVGDAAFQAKCFDYFYELKKSDTTVIFVSHDQGSLERFCDRGILIDKGKMVTYGSMQDVLKSYRSVVLEELDRNDTNKVEVGKDNKVEYAEIFDVAVRNNLHKKSTKFFYQEDILVEYKINIKRTIINPIFGVTIWQKNVEKAILATNTLIDGYENTGTFNKGDVIKFNVKLPNNLNSAEYIVEPAIANESATIFYDQQPRAAKFIINGGNNPHSIISFDEKSSYVTTKSTKK